MTKTLAIVISLAACSGAQHPPASPPPAEPPPPSTTTCYAGTSIGMGQSARTLARRTVDPAAHQITEDVSHDDQAAHGTKSFHVVMTVDGDHFTMTEANNAFRGSGTLVGDPWRWTSWSSTSEIPDTGITVDSDDEVTETGMTATKQIKRGGTVVGSTRDELKVFDCAKWDAAVVELANPPLDAVSCEKACRNFARLKYWERADAQIEALPAADRTAARTAKTAEYAKALEAGLPTCIEGCVGANNGAQTACMAKAANVAELAACS